MQRRNAIPLYYQLETILRRKIVNGELLPGAALPSEDALASEYGISRITVRQALSLLEQDDLIVRQRGRGTFVSENPPLIDSPKFSGSVEDMLGMGIKTKVKVLSMGRIDPPEGVRRLLGLDEGKEVVRIEKVRLVDKSPFSYLINYLPLEYGGKIESADLTTKPLLMILEEELGLKADEAVQSIEATTADAEVARLLEVWIGAPLLKVERTVFDTAGGPIEHVSVLYRADKYKFTVKLRREQSEYNWQRSVEPQAGRK
jgi:GntR family transcriptional regulator